MKTRVITAVVAGAIALLCIFEGKFLFVPFVLFAIGAANYEYFKALKNVRQNVMWIPGAVMFLIPLLTAFTTSHRPDLLEFSFLGNQINFFSILLLIATLTGIVLLIIKNDKYKFQDLCYSLFAGIYLSFLYSFAITIRLNETHGFALFLLALIPSCASDTFALFSGKLFGKHKLCPTLSPNKTIEGAIGAVVGSSITALVFGIVCLIFNVDLSIPLYQYPIMGIIISITAQIGDLIASLIKRECGIKDFGKLLPGHGGILDRIDSYGLVFGFFYIYMELFLR